MIRFTSNSSQVHNILAEMVMGGMVLETNMNEIIMQVDAQNKMEKSEVSVTLTVQLYVWGGVYSMQACVYAAPCMLFSSDLVDAPYPLLSVCALFFCFFCLFSCCCTALNSDQDSTYSLLYLSVYYTAIVITSTISMKT